MEKSCVTILLCDPGWYVDKSDFKKKGEDKTHRHTPSGHIRVYRVTQLRTDGVHWRESAGTGPVVVKVFPVTGAALILTKGGSMILPFTTNYWYVVGMLNLPAVVCMYVCMYVCIVCMVITYTREWTNRARLPILLVVG